MTRRCMMRRSPVWRLTAAVGLIVGMSTIGSLPASAEVIDVPPDGEGRMTISIDADVAALGRISPTLTTAGTDVFGSACTSIPPTGFATAAYQCTGLSRAEYTVGASGAVTPEWTSVLCGLPGLFQDVGIPADLATFPHVQACTIVVSAPGVRIFNLDDAGNPVDPPSAVTLLDAVSGAPIDGACAVAAAGNPPALHCDLAEGEYVVLGADEPDIDLFDETFPYAAYICLPGPTPPVDTNGSGPSFEIRGDEDDDTILSTGIATCRDNPIPEKPFIPDLIVSGTARIQLGVIGTPGTLSEIEPALTIDGVDVFDTACTRVSGSSSSESTTLGYLCLNLERGVYELSAPTIGADDVSFASCSTPGTNDAFSVIDLRDFPYNAMCALYVEPPHIVINDFSDAGTPESIVLLDSSGIDRSNTCEPTTVAGEGLSLSCSPLPPGTYTLRSSGIGADEAPGVYCDQFQPWFSEHIVTLSTQPSVFGASHAPRCDTFEPLRTTELTVLFENPPFGATARIDRDGSDASGACEEGSQPATPAAPGETASAYLCEYELGGTFTPSSSVNPSGIEPTVSCVPTDSDSDVAATASASMTYQSTSWFCLVRLPLVLPATGADTTRITAIGSFALLAGLALLGVGSRRRPLRR